LFDLFGLPEAAAMTCGLLMLGAVIFFFSDPCRSPMKLFSSSDIECLGQNGPDLSSLKALKHLRRILIYFKYRKRAKDETGDVLLQIVVYKSWFHISFRKTMLISFIMVSPMPLCCNQFAAFNGFDGTSRIQKKPWVLDLLCQFRDFSEFPFNQ